MNRTDFAELAVIIMAVGFMIFAVLIGFGALME